jgi:hypothetical protein
MRTTTFVANRLCGVGQFVLKHSQNIPSANVSGKIKAEDILKALKRCLLFLNPALPVELSISFLKAFRRNEPCQMHRYIMICF